MQPDHPEPAVPFRHLPIALATVAAVVGAFWVLLGYRYSPESYEAYRITPYTVELIWFAVALAAAVTAVVWLVPRHRTWRAFARAVAPVAVVSILILAKPLLLVPLRCYDPILFCTACGWGTALWLKAVAQPVGVSCEPGNKNAKILSCIIWTVAALLGAYYVWQQVQYLNDLALGYFDCGGSASLLYNTATQPRELFLGISPREPMFWDHFNPGVLAFVPLWMLWPDLKLLIVLEAVVFVGFALPLYWIGKHFFDDKMAALLMAGAWLVYPSTSQLVYSGSYGLHWGNVCLPLYGIALYLWMKGRHRWALGLMIWGLLIKEETAIVIGMFGLYLALVGRRPRAGLALTAVAFAYFLIVTILVIPPMKMGYYTQIKFFADLGNSTWEILLSPLFKPRVFWGKLFEDRTWYFAAALLGPLLFLPLKKPSILFVGSLTFVFVCMNPIMKSIAYQYQIGLLPVIFWALAAALQNTEARRRRAALAGAIVSGGLLSVFLGNSFWSKDTLPIYRSPGRIELVRRIGRDIRESDSLYATQRVAAHFIRQRRLYPSPPVPPDIDAALIDLQDHWRTTVSIEELRRFRDVQRQVAALPGMQLAAAYDGVLLYTRRGEALDARSLVERDTLPPNVRQQAVDLGHGVRIAGFSVTRVASASNRESEILCVTTYNTVTAQTNVDLAVRCKVPISDRTGDENTFTSVFRPLGQGIWPVSRWETNRFYADDFFVTLPKGLLNEVSRVVFEPAPLTP